MLPFCLAARTTYRWLLVVGLLLGGLIWCIATLVYYDAHPLRPDALMNAMRRGKYLFPIGMLPAVFAPFWFRASLRGHRRRLEANAE